MLNFKKMLLVNIKIYCEIHRPYNLNFSNIFSKSLVSKQFRILYSKILVYLLTFNQQGFWKTGRLSKEEIERMVNDAEKYKAEDESQRERISSKNALESYAFNVKQTVEDDKLKDKISEDDKSAVVTKAKEVLDWLDNNQQAEKDEFEDKQKELEKIAMPIMTKLYQAGGGGPGGMPGK